MAKRWQAGAKGQLRPDERAPVTLLEPSHLASDLLRQLWIPEYRLPVGESFTTMVLPYPCCQFVVEPDGVWLYGPVTQAWSRELTGDGWAVGARLQPAAGRALVGDVAGLADDRRNVGSIGADLWIAVREAMAGGGPRADRHATAAALVDEWLVAQVRVAVVADVHADLARRLVEIVDTDPSIVRVADLAERLGTSVRTVQRIAELYVGMSPASMIRRRRLQEAAQAVRTQANVDLAQVAAQLGYADHAHLTREFRRVLGFTPSTYRADSGSLEQ